MVELFTLDYGRIRAFAKYAQSKKPRFGGLLTTFTHVKVLLNKGRSSFTIREMAYNDRFLSLTSDYERLKVGYLMLASVRMLTQINNENPQLFQLLLVAFNKLNSSASIAGQLQEWFYLVLKSEGLISEPMNLNEKGLPKNARILYRYSIERVFMNIILSLMVMAILAFLVSYIGFKRLLSRSFGGHLVESYALLVGTALRLFNRRLVSILLQVIAASNLIYFFMSHLLSEKLTFAWKAMVVFDLTIILLTAVIAIILLYIPNSVAAIAHQDERTKDQVTQQIIYAGIFQNLSFFAVFICVLILGFLFLGSNGLIAASLGMLVISFYFRSAGGAYKAAAEQAESQKQDGLVLTHPSNILTNSGTMIASVGGFTWMFIALGWPQSLVFCICKSFNPA